MANDNHEVYNSENICTYTDYITALNTFTNEEIDACILSAGTPHGFENRGEISNSSNTEQVAANSISPWYSRSGRYLEYDTQECNQMDPASWQSYYHILYGYWANSNVALCTDMDIKKYRNQVTITPRSNTYYGHTFDYYELSIVTQYGDTGDWNNSVLKPIIIIPTETLRLGAYIGLNSYKHWAITEMTAFPSRHTLTTYNSYISFNDGTGGLAPVTCPCSIGDNFVWTPTSESDSKWMDDEHYNYGWYDINYGGGGGFHAYSFQEYNNIDDLLMIVAICGLKFEYNGTTYKPIVTGGIVTGYTDDMTEESEWDDWENIGDHVIPDDPTPVPPPPGPGYDDDPWHGATFAGAGVGGAGAFAKCYYMTSTELANLRSWMNSINVPEGFDPMQQIIGLSQVPVALSGDGAENVVFVNSSAVYDPGVTTRAVDTGVATQQAMGSPISYYLGSVDIVRRMQERGEPYLDYDCQIELYLPLIGMFSLDTQAVMGRTISAYAVLDPVRGTLAAYAYVTKDGQNLPVAYGSTSIGVDLPISAQQLSVSRAALKQANAQLGASLLSGALTMLAAASSGGKSSGSGAKTSTGSSGLSAAGIREAGSDYMKASQVGNVFGDFMNWGRTIRQLSYGNNTAVAGSFGGSTAQWSYPFTPYVKIIRPRYEKPSNYAHSQGIPCVQTKTVGSCTGFIQCIGADVSGITGATDLELQAIQAALSNGIYAGGGS